MNITHYARFSALLVLAIGAIPLRTDAGSCFVWRVTNTTAPCYLVGTVHSLHAGDYPLPKGYDQALRDSKRLVFEMKPDPSSDYEGKFVRAATYSKGDYVQNHVHAKTWEIIRVNFQMHSMIGQPFSVSGYYVEHGVEQLRPWAIAGIFYGIPGYSGIFDDLGVDDHFWYEGKRHHMEIAGLETDEEHIAVLGGMNDTESELMLVDAIVNRQKLKGRDEKLIAAWKHGDLEGVAAGLRDDYKLNPGAELRLLDMRNKKWIPKIKAEFSSGKPTSIVVGCAHMLGPNGLVGLLKHEGYQFEQL